MNLGSQRPAHLGGSGTVKPLTCAVNCQETQQPPRPITLPGISCPWRGTGGEERLDLSVGQERSEERSDTLQGLRAKGFKCAKLKEHVGGGGGLSQQNME